MVPVLQGLDNRCGYFVHELIRLARVQEPCEAAHVALASRSALLSDFQKPVVVDPCLHVRNQVNVVFINIDPLLIPAACEAWRPAHLACL